MQVGIAQKNTSMCQESTVFLDAVHQPSTPSGCVLAAVDLPELPLNLDTGRYTSPTQYSSPKIGYKFTQKVGEISPVLVLHKHG